MELMMVESMHSSVESLILPMFCNVMEMIGNMFLNVAVKMKENQIRKDDNVQALTTSSMEIKREQSLDVDENMIVVGSIENPIEFNLNKIDETEGLEVDFAFDNANSNDVGEGSGINFSEMSEMNRVTIGSGNNFFEISEVNRVEYTGNMNTEFKKGAKINWKDAAVCRECNKVGK